MRSVANAVGDTTARGRIGSMGLSLTDVDNFSDWWSLADGAQKARLLSDKRHYEELSKEDRLRLNKLFKECPFRGSVPPKEEAEETPKEKKTKPVAIVKKASGSTKKPT